MARLSLLPAQQGGVSPLPGRQQWWPGNRLWATAAQWPRGKQVDGEGQEARLRGELGRGLRWEVGAGAGAVAGAGASRTQPPPGPCTFHWVIHDPSEDPDTHARTPGPDSITDFVLPKRYRLCFISLYPASHVLSAFQSRGLLPESRVGLKGVSA